MNDFDKRIGNRLFRMSCPPASQLGEWELGILDSVSAARIAAHAAICPHCTAELQTLRAQLAAPPMATSNQPPILARVQRFIIDLLNPNREGALTPQLALRDDGEDESVVSQAVGSYLITLSWQSDASAPNLRTLIGDVTPLDEAVSAEFGDWTAHLWHADLLHSQHPLGIDGDLLIDGLAPDLYHLVLTSSNFEAHLQNLRLS